MWVFNKYLFPQDCNSFTGFQDTAEHTQEIQNEPFSLQIINCSLSVADIIGKRIYVHWFC